jgi:hypothetical protein
MAGDARLLDKLRREELVPLGTFHGIPLPPLPEKAAVDILNFLQ